MGYISTFVANWKETLTGQFVWKAVGGFRIISIQKKVSKAKQQQKKKPVNSTAMKTLI